MYDGGYVSAQVEDGPLDLPHELEECSHGPETHCSGEHTVYSPQKRGGIPGGKRRADDGA